MTDELTKKLRAKLRQHPLFRDTVTLATHLAAVGDIPNTPQSISSHAAIVMTMINRGIRKGYLILKTTDESLKKE